MNYSISEIETEKELHTLLISTLKRFALPIIIALALPAALFFWLFSENNVDNELLLCAEAISIIL